ncbi:peptidase S28 [Favolaschia claudopus]|uniref:Peptidase S28 n=1 Tax=Favolaschia claudopus TaxID=2862362 RepID=A0AAW0EFB9_9AGAR
MFLRLSLSLLVLSQSFANGLTTDGRFNANFMRKPALPIVHIDQNTPVTSRNGTILPPYNTTYTFQQLIDHNNPSLGTFTQRYWHTYEFYEEGGPIVMFSPGEGNAAQFSSYLTNNTINGQIAQQENGAVVLLEHRFYGLSNPLPDLSVESLRLLTVQQAIDDYEYFAKNVILPMPNGDRLSAVTTPWILTGGSYSGALTSWTMVNKPGLFAAGYASSAVVEAILDFWQYFEPERLTMPANCSVDVERVIAHIDEVFTGSNQTAIQAIKESFGLGDLTHLDDVAGALRNNLWDWQGLTLSGGPGAQFFKFCDALEVKDGVSAPAAGWGLEHALDAWSSYWKTTYLALLCGEDDVEDCLGTYDTSQPYWTDISIDNSERSSRKNAAPVGHPTLVSRLVQPAYKLRQCQQMFPEAFPQPPNVHTGQINSLYHGWNVSVSNLFFANGQRDPWRYATVSAPGVILKSTPSQPIAVSEGFHCGDLLTREGVANPTVLAVQKQALASIKTWIAAWKPTKVRSVRDLRSRERKLKKPVDGWFRTPVLE